jgi:aminopeptidase N
MGYRLVLGTWFLISAGIGFAQRLPDNVVPSHYALSFSPDLATARFEGHEEIEIHVSKPTNAITLNAIEIEFRKAAVRSDEGLQEVQVLPDPDHQTATLQFKKTIATGNAVIEIDFVGQLNDKLRGFYLTRSSTRHYASTQFESTDARRAFPSFDEPALKATFDISLVVDEGDTAISNGAIISDTPGPGAGKHTIRFATSPKMSTYLVAMAVGDWKCLTGRTDGIPIRICATPDKVELGHFALEASEHILHSFNRYYGIPYPYKKLDIIAIPDFEAGAMENSAAITFREIYLLVDEKNSSVPVREQAALILSHEIAHMWFGDLVTMKWWDDVWLNEGFATWITSKPFVEWKPEWKESVQDVAAASSTLDLDSSPATRQIRTQATTPDEINELFDGIAYGKAAAVLHMLEDYVGADVFRSAVNQYLQKYAYGNATAEDFWNTLAAASHKPIDHIMSSFIDQPGAPLISLKARCSANKMTVSLAQQRFYLQGRLMDASSNQTWAIPVCFKVGAAKDCRILDRKQREFKFDSCPAELSADATGSGYYRVLYDRGIFPRLPGRDWNARERARLLGDTWALVQAGKQSVAEYLELVERMGADSERIVLEEEIQPLPTIAANLVTSGDQEKFSELIRNLLAPVVRRLGWTPAPGESDEDRELRPRVLYLFGRLGKDPDTVHQAEKLADQYLRDHSSLDGSLVSVVLTLAARSGDPSLYQRYADALKTARSPEEYLTLLTGLESFSQPELVERTLALSLSPDVRSQDAPGVIVRLINRSDTRKQAWEWTKEHWSEVHSRFTISSGSRVVAATGSFCDTPNRKDVQEFFAQHAVESSERTLANALHNIDECIDLRAQQGPKLAAWLNRGAKRQSK